MYIHNQFICSIIKTDNARRLLAAGVQIDYEMTLTNIAPWDLKITTDDLTSVEFGKGMRGLGLYIYMY
jgi:hypothetical protein